MAQEAGAKNDLVTAIKSANTGLEALKLSQAAGVALADRVAVGAREVAMATLAGGTEVHVVVYDRQGILVGKSDGEHL